MSGQKVDVKVVLLGREYSGKTSLVERFVHQRFQAVPYQNTIGAAFGARRLDVSSSSGRGGRSLTLGVWDTAGSERYEAMSRVYYRGARAAVVCYDLTDERSFERARFWTDELRRCEPECRIYLCGTKLDLATEGGGGVGRRVDRHDAQDLADELQARLYETSSKSGENVEALFRTVAEDFADEPAREKSGVDLAAGGASAAGGSKCCVK
uniref:Ras-related protein Rab-24 n=1 Tax=Petromyzon marinus TaxID=7757 RepID=A0AAJ7UF11_PETMA|nr:ras-related protein Rab-24 [Petromyzon marinus]